MTASTRHDANRRLLRARDWMDRGFADALDIEAVADSVHLSRAHFIRSFRETFGETPHRYLQRRRIERAMSLLRETDRSVTEICLDVGFTSLGTFSHSQIFVLDQDEALDFYVGKLDREVLEALRAKGVEFTEEPTERFYGIDSALRDPFGNSVRITEPAEVPADPPPSGKTTV